MQININLLPKQAVILNDPHKFKVMVCGRRFGKTEYCSIEHLIKALSGKANAVQWMIAPTFPISKIMWRKLKKVIKEYKLGEYIKDIKEGELYIEFINGATIWCKSADKPENLVGEGLAHVSLDEFGVMKPDVWYESIRPSLLDTGGTATFIGTPKGKNHFYDIYNSEGENWTSFRYTSYDNPLIDPKELEDLIKDMPEYLIRQEILAEFLDEGGEVFKRYKTQLIDLEELIDPNQFIVYGIDLGKLNDFTVIVGYNPITKKPVSYERFNKIDWDYQMTKIKDHVSKTPNHLIIIDSSGVGEPLYDHLKKTGLTVRAATITSGKNVNVKIEGQIKYTVPKSILIQRLAVALELSELYLPNDKYVDLEFGQYSYNLTQSGNISYSAPPGKNDDTVMACSLANFGISIGGNCIGGIVSDSCFMVSPSKDNYDSDIITEYESDIMDWDDFGNI